VLKRLLHALAANPRVYDLAAAVLGGRVSDAKLRAHAASLMRDRSLAAPIVLDVGGGTGRLAAIWPPAARHICIDPDLAKLRRLAERRSGGVAVAASGDRLPVGDASVDAVLMVAVSHHLDDELFARALREARRVLRPHGRLIYFDAVWNPRHLLGRVIWRYDRGAFPRPLADLNRRLLRQFTLHERERYVGVHDYCVWVGEPRQP
jgi:ubiquinone/menaquinone biosynthesis C-methylase UbiE